MSWKTWWLSLFSRRRRKAPVEMAFAPGQSPWRDALLDEGLDARSFPVLRPDREAPQREVPQREADVVDLNDFSRRA